MTHLPRRISEIYFYVIPVLFLFGLFSCKPHENNDVLLKFSTPIINFDTVFTSVGSVTKLFTVHNPSNSEIKTTIFLAGKGSFYSINVDGEWKKENYFKNVVIPKKDSIFIFVQVNIDPADKDNPFLITDSIVFLTGQNIQDVKLLAYGQDARYIIADKKTGFKVVAGENETVRWTKERPYVVYGWAAIDSLGALIIESGTRVYFHNNSGLWAYRGSYLKVDGTLDDPVSFRGDRLESWYDKDYAQWNRIWINEGADADINFAIISNAFIGVQVDPFYPNGQPVPVTINSLVKIENTIIKNTKHCGVMSRFLNVDMTNCLIYNNGASSVRLEGGKYTLKHITISNDFIQAERKDPACYVSNLVIGYYNYPDIPMDIKADFINCIITGRNETEVIVNKKSEEELTTSFQNCLIKSKNSSEYFIETILNKDPLFQDKEKLNFQLKPDSPAIGKGKPNIGVLEDILGKIRKNPPDIGAYESQ